MSHGSNSRNHGHHHDHDHYHSPASGAGSAFRPGLHTLLDGMAMAAAVTTDSLHGHVGVLAGFGTFLAVFLHKPLDAVSITSLMSGTTATKRLAVNLGFALMCPIGAFLFWCGADFSGQAGVFAGWALAFSAGVFLCISLSDLLPEMEFHSHNRIPLSIALLLGIAVAWGIGLVEGEGAHHHHEEHSESSGAEVHDHNGVDDHHHH
ncbi:MAG: ZIP family metal transporter [Pirellulales bacterium]